MKAQQQRFLILNIVSSTVAETAILADLDITRLLMVVR